MPLTDPQKIALRDWLQANLYKAVHTVTFREGVKQTMQVTDPLSGATLDKDVPVMVQDSRFFDTYDEDGNVIGQREEFYMRREYVERTMDMIDVQEVIFRVRAKAIKQGFAGVTANQVRELLSEYRDTIQSWIPGVSWGGSNTVGRHAALTDDPDE
jgi:hypothetical protein